jgi:hypothetical protein
MENIRSANVKFTALRYRKIGGSGRSQWYPSSRDDSHRENRFKDFNGKQPPSFREQKALRALPSRRVDFATPRSAFPDGIAKLQI